MRESTSPQPRVAELEEYRSTSGDPADVLVFCAAFTVAGKEHRPRVHLVREKELEEEVGEVVLVCGVGDQAGGDVADADELLDGGALEVNDAAAVAHLDTGVDAGTGGLEGEGDANSSISTLSTSSCSLVASCILRPMSSAKLIFLESTCFRRSSISSSVRSSSASR